MNKKANPALVGAFVIGAVALTVAAVVLFSKSEFTQKKRFLVMYFDESIGGLDVGAPIEFGGVRVGTVSNIHLVLNQSDNSIRIPVIVQLEEKRITLEGVDNFETDVESLEDQVAKGMRAQLASQSMLTGKLKIMLDYFPDSEIKLHPDDSTGYDQMPTIPSPLKRIAREMENLPFREIVIDARKAVNSLSELLGSEQTQALFVNLSDTLESLNTTVNKLNEHIDPLATGAADTMESASDALDGITATMENLDTKIQELLDSVSSTADQAGNLISEDSPLRYELWQTLREFTAAARSIRNLADTLEQNPEALIQGKPKE